MLDNDHALHNSQDIFFRNPVGAAEAGSRIKINIHLKTKEEIKGVLLRLWQDRQGEKLITLKEEHPNPEQEDHDFCAWVTMPPQGCLLWYYFILSLADGICYYGNNPEQLGGRGQIYPHEPPSFQITVFNKGAKTPDWFKHSVMYQIFPDRYCRVGDQIVGKKGAVMHMDWEDDPCYYKDPDTKEIVAYDFFGGNLKGIRSKLDHLKELGISVIYLNPVFESESNHHYDTGDYKKIDPVLGTNEEFRELVQEAKKKGIRILLDGGFSHTGSNSRYFNRKGEYDSIGAFQSPESPYYSWYNFRHYPYEYDCWWNFNTLPNVTETTPSYMDFIINDADSVLHHWMKAGIGGWRLDVIDELPATFSQAFYKELKHTDPDAVMIGEVWEDCSHKIAYGVAREYLCGQEMDSAMNYPFRQYLFDFLTGSVDPELCARRFRSLRENYPKENYYAMMNLIGSHDRARAITILGEAPYYDGMPAVEQSRFRMSTDQYNLGMARLLMAIGWQMTYPGVPSIYYGDEIGMQGFKDPYNRRPYTWDHKDTYIEDTVKALVKLRNEHTVLQTGAILPLYAHGDVMAYARVIEDGHDVFGAEAKDEAFIYVANRSREEKKEVTLDVSDFAEGAFVDALHPDDGERWKVVNGHITVSVPPLKAYVLQRQDLPYTYEHLAGILLHPTSLPSKYGIGGLGKEAFRFVDYLVSAGQSVWQMLPIGPLDFGNSPYQSPSAFAGNELLIDIDDLLERGWLNPAEARIPFESRGSFVDYPRATEFKQKCLRKAWARYSRTVKDKGDFQAFCEEEAWWLDDYALFKAAKKEFRNRSWNEWPSAVRSRDPQALKELTARLEEPIGLVKFGQYIFHMQWKKLHDYASEHGIRLLGDVPIFLSYDSADVWANQQQFLLNGDGSPKTVAGVPPDYFSATGQLWGNPHYDWAAMEKDGFRWWKARLRKLYEFVDIVRIDHFRGFEAYWAVDAKADTAINGHWVKGPGKALFDALKEELGDLPIVAEDLGIITDEVEKLRDDCGFPGMKVLQFMLHFNEQHRMGFVAPENSIIYTGTHDNNTTVGWYTQELDDATRASVADLVGANPERPADVCRGLIGFAYRSNARIAIIPMQDILALDERHRMNTPGTVGLNWGWCLKPEEFMRAEGEAPELRVLAGRFGRLPEAQKS